MSSEKISLGKFGKSFQEGLVQLIFEDRQFADQITEVLDVDFLELEYLRVFVRKILDYRERYNKHPSVDALITILRVELDQEEPTAKEQVVDYFRRIHKKERTDGEFIKETSLDFCRKQKLKEAMMKSVGLLQRSSFDEISKIINESLKLGSENNFGYDYMVDFDTRFLPKIRNPVTTGWSEIDNIVGGGLGKSELGVVVAPTGAGKSMVLVHLGAQAMKAGKNVIHYTLELQDTVIATRYDSCITGYPLSDIINFKEEVFDEIKDIDGSLIVKEYPTKSATTNTIRAHLSRLAKRGIKPGMIIVDYADLLKPVVVRKEKRNELESIYEELRGLSTEFQCPIWTASQTNRCLWVDTKLLINRDGKTESIRIGDVIEGDLVETHKGLKKITKVFPQEEQETYKITLKSGKTLICSGRHQFPTSAGKLKSIDEGLSVSDKLITRKKETEDGD